MLIVAAVPYTSEKFLVFMVMLAFDFSCKDSKTGQVNQIHPSDIGGGSPLRKRNKGVQCKCVLEKYFFREESRGGGYSHKIWVGVCGPLPKTLTLFMTKMAAKWLKSIPNL